MEKQFANTALERVRDDLTAALRKELGDVKHLVATMTSQATEHRETLQEEYSRKLEKMKGIVTEYFTKYEKCLMHQQELCAEMERRQEEWVRKLIQP